MKKIFFTVFSISQICFLLIWPKEALAAAKEGMNLWLNILLPTLLPFLILTGILIQTDMTERLLKPAEKIWNKLLGVTAAKNARIISAADAVRESRPCIENVLARNVSVYKGNDRHFQSTGRGGNRH